MSLTSRYFYHSQFRNYVIVFGHMFKDIEIVRSNANGTENHRETVPLHYSNKAKFIQRLIQDENLERDVAIKLPRMAFEMVNPVYSAERKTSSKQRFRQQDPNNANNQFNVYNPVPYDLNFDLSLIVKSQDVGFQVIEQIMPFFTPDFTVAVNALNDPDLTFDVPTSLIAVNRNDEYSGTFEDPRTQVWDLSFVMKAVIFGPTRTTGVIKQADINFFDSDDPTKKYADLEVVPFIDGVDPDDIEEDDDWTAKTTITEDFSDETS